MQHSKYFATTADPRPPPPCRSSGHQDGAQPSALTSLRSRKRKQRESNTEKTTPSTKPRSSLTSMEKQVVRLRKAYPDTLLLFECGYRMRIFGEDAEVSTKISVTNLTVHKKIIVWWRIFQSAATVLGIRAQQHKNFLETSVPVHRTLFHARRLVHAGFKVGVVKQVDSVAMRAANKAPGAQRKPLERQYTRSTKKRREARPSQKMYALASSYTSNTGESKFDEFEDELLDPVEFALPAGRLSAYTEQVLESFVATQSDSVTFSSGASAMDDLKSSIRVERIPNRYFDYSVAKETFTRVFLEAETEYTSAVANPNLPKFPTSTFSGQFHLPTEAHRDLDLFVNSTTRRGVGSLLSILNHTKTNAGARKLRDWIHTPLVAVQEIMARQKTIESKHLLKYLQQVHLGKATPSQAVGALQILQDLEDHINGLKATFAITTNQDQFTVLEWLLEGYPTLQARVSDLLDEVDVKHARQNDVENTIQRLLCRKPSQARKYREFTRELETLAREVHYVQRGSLSDIHHLIQVKRTDLHEVPQGWLVVNSTKKLVRFHPKQILQLHVQEEFVNNRKSNWFDPCGDNFANVKYCRFFDGCIGSQHGRQDQSAANVCARGDPGSNWVFRSCVKCAVIRFDGIHTLMHRSITINCSSCSQELTTLGLISRNATKRSLVLIDEVGYGMAAQYAEAVAVGQMMYLIKTVGCLVVFATHFTAAIHKLQARLGDKCQTKQLEYHFYDQEEADKVEGAVTFHYVLKDGVASDSFAIETARRAGIASAILERARQLRGSL
ncbi:P-loop containing nucleoside triphosphate hydrolase [Phytophthora cactorum]|nr:P-loop containing nucleoside triphosphate hydrolase [Phytophthora cactorum]